MSSPACPLTLSLHLPSSPLVGPASLVKSLPENQTFIDKLDSDVDKMDGFWKSKIIELARELRSCREKADILAGLSTKKQAKLLKQSVLALPVPSKLIRGIPYPGFKEDIPFRFTHPALLLPLLSLSL
jgi:hypothetical protein